MNSIPERYTSHEEAFAYQHEQEKTFLREELREAHKMNRNLFRQLKKAQQATEEALRAHAKMVETLTETMRENAILMFERDRWKSRAEKRAEKRAEQASSNEAPDSSDADFLPDIGKITIAEARVIRKAIARLHHPDSGGNTERMQAWNALLDRIERCQ